MKFVSLLLTALLVVTTAYSQTHEELQQLLAQGEKEWNAGNPDKSFMSAGNSIDYGLGYLKKNKFTESLWYFDEVLKKDSTHIWANVFAGLAHTGLKQYDAAAANFSRLGSVPAMQQKLRAFLEESRQQVKQAAVKETKTTKATAPVKTNTSPKANTPVKQTATTKPVAQPAKDKAVTTENKKGGSLVYGDYVFTLDYWDVSQKRMVHQQKGYFTLRSNGTYTYMGTTGKYSYHPASGIITWQSGSFRNMGKNTTTFQRNKTTCQIDFEYQTAGGKVYYSGGRNL